MVFVVAEIGVNWNGDYSKLLELVKGAKKAGCNAIKLQSFKPEMVKDHPNHDLLAKSTITEKNVKEIDKIAKKNGIEWFCTPMYPEAVEFLEKYVRRYKIRFHDGISIIENRESEILKRILQTKKEVIISSQKSPKESKHYNNNKIKWLYCVPKYPCSIKEINFSEISEFDGFSNHCMNKAAVLTSVALGAKIIEIHITLSKNDYYADNPVSFEIKELKELVNLMRDIEKIKK